MIDERIGRSRIIPAYGRGEHETSAAYKAGEKVNSLLGMAPNWIRIVIVDLLVILVVVLFVLLIQIQQDARDLLM